MKIVLKWVNWSFKYSIYSRDTFIKMTSTTRCGHIKLQLRMHKSINIVPLLKKVLAVEHQIDGVDDNDTMQRSWWNLEVFQNNAKIFHKCSTSSQSVLVEIADLKAHNASHCEL